MSYLILFFVSCLLSIGLQWIGMILPWLFGPMISAILLQKYTHYDYHWPKGLSDVGLYILGAQIGVSFTKEILHDIQMDYWNIIMLSLLVILSAVIIAFIFKWIVGCTLETALLSSIPGALNQMIVMAEENKASNILVVTLAQTSRLIFVILIVPFISTFTHDTSTQRVHYIQHAKSMLEVLNIGQILFLIICMIVAGYTFKRLHFPVPDMLGPIFVMLVWNLSTGLNFTVPMPLINVAQILFGIRVGLQIFNLSNQINRKLFIGILVQNILLIFCTFVICICMQQMTTHPFNDLFLSAAPGGMAQIIIVGLETKANVAMISSYHIFRIFFILLIISPWMSWYLTYRSHKNQLTEKT